MANLNWLPTNPFPRDPLYPANIYAGGSGPQLNNLDLEDAYHPFKVYVMELESNGSNANGKVGMEYKSTVYKNQNGFGFQPIVGLLTDRLDFDDSGWTGFPTQEKIVYLQGTVSGGNVTQIDVNWDLDVSQLSTKKRLEGGSPVTPENQTGFFLPIARLFRYGSEPQKLGVEQYVKTHLLLYKVTFGEDTGWYPVPGPGGGGAAASQPSPWQIVELTGEGTPNEEGEYSSYSFRVYPGTINNILPTNTFSNDGLVKFTIQANGIKYLFLDVNTDGTKVTTATLKVESTLPTNAAPVGEGIAPSKIVIPLGIIQNNSPIALRSSALTASPAVAGSRSKAPSSPNDEPFVRLWMWRVEGK